MIKTKIIKPMKVKMKMLNPVRSQFRDCPRKGSKIRRKTRTIGKPHLPRPPKEAKTGFRAYL